MPASATARATYATAEVQNLNVFSELNVIGDQIKVLHPNSPWVGPAANPIFHFGVAHCCESLVQIAHLVGSETAVRENRRRPDSSRKASSISRTERPRAKSSTARSSSAAVRPSRRSRIADLKRTSCPQPMSQDDGIMRFGQALVKQ